MTINSFKEDDFYLSNFFPCKVNYDGITYQNAEAAFQAQKCVNKEDRLKFVNLDSTLAKKLGRKVNLRSDWEDVKVKIMRDVVDTKFSQNDSLREKLVSTGDAYLEEGNDWGDRTWGTVNGQGANLLGNILMELREKYKKDIVLGIDEKKVTNKNRRQDERSV